MSVSSRGITDEPTPEHEQPHHVVAGRSSGCSPAPCPISKPLRNETELDAVHLRLPVVALLFVRANAVDGRLGCCLNAHKIVRIKVRCGDTAGQDPALCPQLAADVHSAFYFVRCGFSRVFLVVPFGVVDAAIRFFDLAVEWGLPIEPRRKRFMLVQIHGSGSFSVVTRCQLVPVSGAGLRP